MTKILAVARRELKETLRNRALHLFAGVLGLLFLVACLVGFSNHRSLQHERERLQQTVDQQFQSAPDRHPHRMAHFGSFAFRPKPALGFFDTGVDGFTGNSVFLEAHRQNPANFSEARHSTGMMRFGELTMAMILQTLVPLLIIFLSFGAVTREREQGTLALLYCQGLSSRELLLGKILGGYGALLVLIAPPAALGLGLVLVLGQADPARLALLGLSYGLYFAIWTLLAVWVSARQRSSSAALMALLSLWVVLVVLLPRTLPNVGESLVPAPSKPEFDLALHLDVAAQGNGHDPNDPAFQALKQELLKRNHTDKLENLPVNFNGLTMQRGERQSTEAYRRHFDRQQELYRQQNRVSEWGGLFDPFLAIRQLSMALAGTDAYHFEEFSRQAEAHRFAFVDKLNEIHVNEVKFEGDKEQRVGADHWKEFQAFVYRQPALGWALGNQPVAPFTLLIWFVGLGAFLSRQRIEVR